MDREINSATLGAAIQRKRTALDLTRQQLAPMENVSHKSFNGIEHGLVNATLDTLGRQLGVLGLTLEVDDPEAVRQAEGMPTRARWITAKGASVSCAGKLTPEELELELPTGQVPVASRAHLAQVLDEAPLQLVTKIVVEVAARR